MENMGGPNKGRPQKRAQLNTGHAGVATTMLESRTNWRFGGYQDKLKAGPITSLKARSSCSGKVKLSAGYR